ncbi:MAG: hypothetical protein GX620_03830 [Chloroflexi bacterium]|nr:hypothetical protein [Chloroflexota bacterium]
METDVAVRERLEFLKLEYGYLQAHQEHLENAEWKSRQLSVTLWLAAMGVGLGLQGVVTNGLYFLIIGTFIPFLFLYIDARIGRWHSAHRARFRQIEAFVNGQSYEVPGADSSITFAEFCTNPNDATLFTVLDFDGRLSCSRDPEYKKRTGATYPQMIVGVRRIFYHSQILVSLIVLALQLYKVYRTAWVYAIIALGPVFYLAIYVMSKVRDARLQSLNAEYSPN